MKLTHAEAIRYLQLVPKSDGLDLVFLSHLRRIPDERNYISNEIVENSFTGGSLQRLSQGGVLFSNGEEHRHNFGRGGEGWGHVMLLDILKLIQPVSIGPGIMREGTDRIPLQHGIKQARADGGTVIWCHNTFGFEDIPNWVKGLVHAQNIYDGSPTGENLIQRAAATPLLSGIEAHLVLVGHADDKRRSGLDKAADTLTRAGATTHTAVLSGEVEPALHAYQREQGCDLLVMGAYGHTRIRHMLVGSTTTDMIRRAEVPVLITR